jgi:hypothetical protein
MKGHYLYTQVVSSGKGVPTSEKGATEAPTSMLVCVKRTLGKGSAEGAMIVGSYWRR